MKSEILFVDDEEVIRRLATRHLSRKNFTVTVLESAESLQNVLEERKPSVVFLDIMMPGRSGMDVLRDIKRIDPGIPVVMVSGHLNSDLAKEAAREGACDYILKPIDWDHLSNTAHLYSFLGEAA
jgi:two-component system C4-dicarboxylate transport response regulator DctD